MALSPWTLSPRLNLLIPRIVGVYQHIWQYGGILNCTVVCLGQEEHRPLSLLAGLWSPWFFWKQLGKGARPRGCISLYVSCRARVYLFFFLKERHSLLLLLCAPCVGGCTCYSTHVEVTALWWSHFSRPTYMCHLGIKLPSLGLCQVHLYPLSRPHRSHLQIFKML